MGEGAEQRQIILNAGNNNQIVTIVPSSSNPHEMSYVLIVEQPQDQAKDEAIYDFNEVGIVNIVYTHHIVYNIASAYSHAICVCQCAPDTSDVIWQSTYSGQ